MEWNGVAMSYIETAHFSAYRHKGSYLKEILSDKWRKVTISTVIH